MEKILGIGGFFFRSKDTQALKKWYADHFGIVETPSNYDDPCWRQSGGTTVFEPFKEDTDYFGDPAQQWMINFRVRDLAAMVAQLRAAGIAVEADEEEYPNGLFARLQDPEGNPIQLWQPTGASLADEEKAG
ncbi:MAG: VOC family protein [Pseudomonadota bacterium]